MPIDNDRDTIYVYKLDNDIQNQQKHGNISILKR